MMVLTMGLYREELPAEAVAKAFRGDGLLAEHVEVQAVQGELRAYRWWLRPDAPEVVDSEVTAFDIDEAEGPINLSNFHHPVITQGVVVEAAEGWIVACGDESEADMVAAARRHVFDMELMLERSDGG